MKHVYVISFHKNFSQLKRLISALSHPNVYFVIHVCKNYRNYQKVVDFYSNNIQIRFCKRERSTWGSYYIGKAQFNGIVEAVQSFAPFDRLTTLSGQDYPIRSNSQIVEFLKSNKGIEFMQFGSTSPELNSKGKYWHPIKLAWTERNLASRYEMYYVKIFRNNYLRIPGELNTEPGIKHVVVNNIKKMLSRIIPPRKFLKDHQPYLGPNWFTITYDFSKYMVDNYANNRKFHRYMKHVFSGSEMIFQTILMNSPYKKTVINKNLHEIRWLEGKRNPEVFSSEDFKHLMGLEESKLFARKFDSTKDSKILDLIDQHRIQAEMVDTKSMIR